MSASMHADQERVRKARDVLRHAIVASGIPAFQGVAILSAAECLGKELVRAQLNALAAELDADRLGEAT